MKKSNTPSPFVRKLTSFFEAWKKLPAPKEDTHKEEEPDCASWNSFFKTFAEVHQSALSSGNCVDIFSIDEIGHKEMRYSAVLAWLLNSRADHGQGRVFFDGLLSFLQKRFPSTTMPDFSGPYSVITESATDTHKRMDILIEGQRGLLVIEVKVNAREHGNQLSNYAEWLGRQPGKSGQLIYLTRTGVQGSSKEALPLRWKDIARCISATLKDLEENSRTFSHSTAHTVTRQYCRKTSQL